MAGDEDRETEKALLTYNNILSSLKAIRNLRQWEKENIFITVIPFTTSFNLSYPEAFAKAP